MKYLITYELDGVTEILSFAGRYYTFDTKAQAQKAMSEERDLNPEIKGWRIIRRYV